MVGGGVEVEGEGGAGEGEDMETIKVDIIKTGTIKVETIKVETIKVEIIKVETIKVEIIKAETIKIMVDIQTGVEVVDEVGAGATVVVDTRGAEVEVAGDMCVVVEGWEAAQGVAATRHSWEISFAVLLLAKDDCLGKMDLVSYEFNVQNA